MNGANTGRLRTVRRAHRALLLTAAGGLLAMLATGCAGGGKSGGDAGPASAVDASVKPEQRYKVLADEVDFFHNSVLQPGGADEKLKRDTRVTLIKHYGGYAQIQANGTTGYVASNEVGPLSAADLAAEEAVARAQQAPAGALAPVSGPGSTYSIPPEATRETVLPVPDSSPAGKPTPNPMFRY